MKEKLNQLFETTVKSSMIHECIMHVESGDGSFSWRRGYGGRTTETIINLASITKLFTTTCIINLIEQGKISLEDKISRYFDAALIDKLHVYKGRDYSESITVGNLLFQNTGFPDVYAAEGNRLNKRMIAEDFSIALEDYVEIIKRNKKKFAPGTKGKAHYSDLNFEMLGRIIELAEGSSLHQAYKKYIFDVLHLQKTYLLEKESDYCADIYYKHEPLHRPNFWMSIPASGGAMSTTSEVMIFLKAFFHGRLFDKKVFDTLRKFAAIQYCPPLGQYGGGFVRLNISGIASFYQLKGELIGHMGGSGSYAYYYPEKDLYFVGDVNQFAKPDLVFALPLKQAKIAYSAR